MGLFGLTFKYFPKWIEARTSSRISDNEFAKELRDELLGRLNECEIKHEEMLKENGKLRHRITLLEDGDRRKTMALALLMNEISRLDPSSDIIARAKAVMELSAHFTTPYDQEMQTSLDKLHGED